jgi:hypothetical protein
VPAYVLVLVLVLGLQRGDCHLILPHPTMPAGWRIGWAESQRVQHRRACRTTSCIPAKWYAQGIDQETRPGMPKLSA